MFMKYASNIPRIGDIKINAVTLSTPLSTIAPPPALTRVAPTNPPTNVCDELDGKPKYQVTKFHTIAAVNAAAITVRFITLGSTIPFPIVVATCREKTQTAAKLKNAASETALKGDSTLVDTTVAIEFALS